MPPIDRLMLIPVAVLLAGAIPDAAIAMAYPDPQRYEKDIAAFENEARENPPPSGAVVVIGSSTIRGWHSNIAKDLAPMPIIARGFGGSTMNDALHYVDRIVTPYEPRAVVVYEGDNDIASGVSPEVFVETFRALKARVHAKLPKARIYVVSVKPSISRWKVWPVMQEANELLKKECRKDGRLIYVDVASAMLGPDGQPLSDNYVSDGLHLSRKGYETWRDVIRPVLLKREPPAATSTTSR